MSITVFVLVFLVSGSPSERMILPDKKACVDMGSKIITGIIGTNADRGMKMTFTCDSALDLTRRP